MQPNSWQLRFKNSDESIEVVAKKNTYMLNTLSNYIAMANIKQIFIIIHF